MKTTLHRIDRNTGKTESSDSAAFWDHCVERIRKSTGLSVADVEIALTNGETLETTGYLYRTKPN